MRRLATLTVAAALAVALGSAFLVVGVASADAADFQALSISGGTIDGNQSTSPTIGVDFSVISPITITALGAFDDDANGISVGNPFGGIEVFIYDLDNLPGPLATVKVIGSTDPLMGQFRFKDIAPLTLGPGNYTVIAWGFDGIDENGNLAKSGFPLVTNDGGGLISFVNSRFSGLSGVSPEVTFPTSLTVPTIGCAGQPEACFAGGSFIFAAAGPTEVDIDIKPGSDPNSINLCSMGVIPVAILGSASFDVNMITDAEIADLRLGDAMVKMVGKAGDKSLCSIKDVNNDGFDDLVCKFVTVDLVETAGTIELTVFGENNGTPFEGTDDVNIVKFECG